MTVDSNVFYLKSPSNDRAIIQCNRLEKINEQLDRLDTVICRVYADAKQWRSKKPQEAMNESRR
jgi:hypothetical protein